MTGWIVRGTIWIALLAFVAAEAGRWYAARRQRPIAWAPRVFLLGALVCATHFLAALYWHHEWSHARAMEFTAQQTQAVYGFAWPGGFWINYLFLAVWLAEAVWWVKHPQQATAQPSAARWWLRALYAIVMVNAAVVFTSGASRGAGVVLILVLTVLWWPARTRDAQAAA